MKIQDIRKMAGKHKIDSFGMTKMQMIRALQKAEGNFDCYGRAASGFCDQGACLWKEDCLKDSAGASAVKGRPPAAKTAPKAAARKR